MSTRLRGFDRSPKKLAVSALRRGWWVGVGLASALAGRSRLFVLGVAGWSPHPHWFRVLLLRLAGVSVGRRVLVFHGLSVRAKRRGQVVIGDRVFLNRNVDIDVGDNSSVTISSDCAIGVGVVIAAVDHEAGVSERRAGVTRPRPVAIGAGCWLGARVVVLPGVTIAPGCVVGAGAVVTRDTDPDGVYAGVPARRLRDLSPPTPGGGGYEASSPVG